MAETISVQVCFATPQATFLREIRLSQGATIQDAVMKSGILQAFPEIDLQHNRLGIHGKLKTPESVLREQDRIEIYRPLVADPKESRRNRVASASKKLASAK